MKKLSILPILGLILIAVSCKPLPPFHTDTVPNKSSQFSKVLKKIELPDKSPINSTKNPLIIFQTKMPKSAIAYNPADSKILWKQATPNAVSKYVVTRDAVVFFDSVKGISALSIKDGRPIWNYKIAKNNKFLGMSGNANGKIAFVTIYRPMGSVLNQTSTVTLLNGTSGKKIWDIKAKGRMGFPTLTKNIIMVPYRSHYLVFLDVNKPVEIARLHITKGEIRFITVSSNGIFFGDKYGVYSLSKDILQKLKEKKFIFSTDVKNLEFRFASDHYDRIASNYSAYDIRMLHGNFINDKGKARYENNDFVFNMFKYFFGFHIDEKGKANLKWAVTTDVTNGVVAATNVNKNIYYVTNNGSVVGLSIANGNKIFEDAPIGESIKGATFDLGGFSPKEKNLANSKSLLDSLTDIANDTDTRFPLAKRFAIDALAVVGGAGVSRLIKLITNKRSSEELKKKAEHDLVSHPDPKGLPLYLDLLKKKYDYITGSKPLAVSIMAKVVAKLKSKESVKILISLLNHNQTTRKQLLAITNALLEIGDKSAVRPFREFLLAYRADPEFAREIHPLQKMAEGLFKLGGPRDRQVLTFIAEDSRTLPRLKEYVVRMLKETRKKKTNK